MSTSSRSGDDLLGAIAGAMKSRESRQPDRIAEDVLAAVTSVTAAWLGHAPILCPSWCTSDLQEHRFDVKHQQAVIHGSSHVLVSYSPDVDCGLSVERLVEPDGRAHDVVWFESEQIDVGDAEAFARASCVRRRRADEDRGDHHRRRMSRLVH